MNEWDLQSVLEHYGFAGTLSSGWRTIRCVSPNHEDRTGSARANLSGYKCMGCDLSGDAIQLIQRLESCDFRGAIEKYEAITGDRNHDLSRPVEAKRRSWGIPPFSEDKPNDDRQVSTGVRRQPDLWR